MPTGKPRASLSFRKSAEVYFNDESWTEHDTDGESRDFLAQAIRDAKFELNVPDPNESAWSLSKSGERRHRKAVRMALQQQGWYEEWDTAVQEGPDGPPPEAGSVNRTAGQNVSF